MRKYLHFKKLIALFLFVLICMSANAAPYIQGDVLYINGSGETAFENLSQVSGYDGTTIKKIVMTGNFTSGWSSGWLINATAESGGNSAVETIDMSGADFSGTSSWSFGHFHHLKTINWPAAGKITNIPLQAFNDCAIEEVHIPGYITNIATHAFNEPSDAHYLKRVYFDEYDADGDGVSDVNMTIGYQAFSNNYGLTDVYINTTGTVSASNMAFPEWSTYGHADPDRDLAALHFPEGKAADYVNLGHVLTEAVASNDADFHDWLMEHYRQANQAENRNGWWEFINAGEDNGTPWGQTFLRTFSHPTLSHIVPPGVKAYIVNTITTNTSSKEVSITLKKVNVIPANTGVIIFGGANSKNKDGNPTLVMTAVDYEGEIFDVNNSTNKNYLSATARDKTKKDEQVYIKPYDVMYGQVYRTFLLGSFDLTDSGKKYYKKYHNYGTGSGSARGIAGNWMGFFRTKEGLYGPNKAYLCLDNSTYGQVDGGEIIITTTDQLNENNSTQYYRIEYPGKGGMNPLSESDMKREGYWYLGKNGDKFEWKDQWGTRSLDSSWAGAKYTEELDDEEWMELLNSIVTGISKTEVDKNDGDIYTLQGVKVTNPSKGVFIKNGKKYIVK